MGTVCVCGYSLRREGLVLRVWGEFSGDCSVVCGSFVCVGVLWWGVPFRVSISSRWQPFVVVSVGLARLLRESTLSLGNFWLLRVVARYCGVGPALSAQAADKARECCKQVSTVNWRPAKSQIDPP